MLFGSLSRPGARWKVIAQQVILGQWNAGGAPVLPAAPDLPVLKLRSGGNALNPDQWDGYTAERARLFEHIRANGVDNVVVLTGDVHTSWALDLTEDPYDPVTYDPATGAGALGVEFVTPSVSSANFEALGPAGVLAFEAATLADNPHVKFVDFDDHGYLVLHVTPDRVQSDWYFVDTVLQPSSGQRLAASWETRAGERHVRRAAAPVGAGGPVATVPAAEPRSTTAAGPTTGTLAMPATLPVTGAPVGVAAAAAFAAIGLAGKVIERRVRLADAREVDR
jgi:alkaline phosphatase D